MSPVVAATIVLGTGLATAAIWWLVRPLTPRERLRDLSLICEDRTEALARITDRAEQDALLDVRLRAMGGAG